MAPCIRHIWWLGAGGSIINAQIHLRNHILSNQEIVLKCFHWDQKKTLKASLKALHYEVFIGTNYDRSSIDCIAFVSSSIGIFNKMAGVFDFKVGWCCQHKSLQVNITTVSCNQWRYWRQITQTSTCNHLGVYSHGDAVDCDMLIWWHCLKMFLQW